MGAASMVFKHHCSGSGCVHALSVLSHSSCEHRCDCPAAVAKKKAPDGMATAGLVMSIIACSLSLLL